MSAPERPVVECEQQHPSIPVRDLDAAVKFYTETLGFELGFTWGDPPMMAGVNLGEQQIFLNKGEPGGDDRGVYFVIDEVEPLFAYQKAMGAEIVEPPGDRPWGFRDFRVRDLDGHVQAFGQRLNAAEPKIPIERVDVPVRLERRLAAVLADLAARNRVTVSECLEETLLHTFAGVGPHTKGTLAAIARLMQKHGIDYDVHGSYRFEER